MPISVTCHGCGKRLKAKDSLVGRTVPCPACGVQLTIGSADEVAAAALLRDDEEAPPAESAAPAPGEETAPPEPPAGRPRRRVAVRPAVRKPVERTELQSLPPLSTNDPPLWLRHLHWLLVLSLIPLGVLLLQQPHDRTFVERLEDTIAESPEPDTEARVLKALHDVVEDKGSLENVYAALPGHKLSGAWLPRDTHAHWLLTAGAALLFFLFLLALSLEGSAKAQHLLLVGVFTSTAGLLFLFAVQAVAEWTQGVIIFPRGVIGILFLVVQLIGFSYRAAADPDSGFLLSLMGFTLGVGLCEEIVKVLPVIFINRRPNGQSWRGAYLWGLASGLGFGLAEGVIYAADFYNGVSGAGIYFVRNLSCVALHAIWTGSAAITVHRRQQWFQQEMAWYDWIVRCIAVVGVPMVLHGLYDTLLKKDCNAAALVVAVLSFVYLAIQIGLLRGSDDQQAHKQMLREYQRRRKVMGAP